MKGTKWWVATGVTTVAVAATVTGGVYFSQRMALDHGEAQALPTPTRQIEAFAQDQPVDNTQLAVTLQQLAQDPALGTFGARVVDVQSGEVVYEKVPMNALQPASSTKLLTSVAALKTLGSQDRITTTVVASGTMVTIKAAGDVWMTSERLDDLANQIKQKVPTVDQVLVDTSAWKAPSFASGWDSADIEAGYIAPMEPIMLYGARIGATEGEVPRSHTPAFDVAAALGQRLGTNTIGYTDSSEGDEVASTQSPTLEERLTMMMAESDNVMAEAIGRELDATDPAGRVQSILKDEGFDLTNTYIEDTSGLSTANVVTPALLSQLMTATVKESALRPLIETLPVAGATGTLADRYADLSGRGWVRAKTGTLTGTSALVGIVPNATGHIYSFGLMSNGSDVDSARKALDRFTSAIRES